MMPRPVGDEKVQAAMRAYEEKYDKEFPIDFRDMDYPTAEIAVADIMSFVDRGTPIKASELVDTEKIFGEEIDLSEYLDS